MGGSVKKIVTIAVAVAIPFVAPYIASSAALAGITGSIGLTATSALVGAGLGAANASIMGGDVGRGALMGGIGGGIGGYNYNPAPTVSLTEGGAPVYDYNAATNSMVPAPGYQAPVYDYDAATNSMVPAPGFDNAAAPGLSNVPSDSAFNAPNAKTPLPGDVSTTQTFADGPMGPPVPPGSTVVGQSTVAPMSFAEAVRAIPGELKAKFTDPKALADLTLRAAGSLAGSYFAGDGMSDQEKKLIEAQTNELRALQVSNKALFDQKLQAAQDLIGESKYFDPEYFGLQRARKAQLAGAKAKRAGLRGLEGGRRASEERRFDLATGRDTGTAFDQGFGAGVAGRTQTLQAGLTAMPGMQTGYGADYKNIYDQYAAADRRSTERAKGIGDLFGSFVGTSKAKA